MIDHSDPLSPGGAAEKDEPEVIPSSPGSSPLAKVYETPEFKEARAKERAAEGRSRAVPALSELLRNLGAFCRHKPECPQLKQIANCDCGLGAAQEALIDAWHRLGEAGASRPVLPEPPDPPHVRSDYREVWLSGWRAALAALTPPTASRPVLPGDVVEAEMTRLMQPDAQTGRYLSATETWNLLLEFVRKNRTLAPDTEDGNR